ncbi:MAG: TIGR04222 domain-containing membrane protein [Bacteroidales bacterium]|nr:TIGR04222 domain-containing membrane protein [Bacteroidales bacterium]
MIEELVKIPGPIFLIYFTLYCGVVILLSRWFVLRDFTSKYEVPEPTTLTPLDISILKNGVPGAITATLYSLSKKKLIKVSKNQHGVFIKKSNSKTTSSEPLEQLFLNYVGKSTRYSSFFKKTSKKTVAKRIAPNIEKLKKLRLIPDKEVKQYRWLMFILAIILILTVGITKTNLGIANDKPVGLLVLLQLVALVALYFAIKPLSHRVTYLGHKVLKKMKIRFEWVLNESDTTANPNTNDILFALSIWGVAPLMSTYLAGDLQAASLIDKATRIKSASSFNTHGCSGCSSGCGGGGTSSGCSGGGCSSGCGGGCGGCGGCGG